MLRLLPRAMDEQLVSETVNNEVASSFKRELSRGETEGRDFFIFYFPYFHLWRGSVYGRDCGIIFYPTNPWLDGNLTQS